MRILVTGASGLVGKNLKYFVENNDVKGEWIYVTSNDCDLRNGVKVLQLFENIKPTHVINLAAYVGGLYKNMDENLNFFMHNMMINMNVMEACYIHKVNKLISLMSTCIFPDKIEYPIDEGMLHNGPPHKSNYGYSYAKRMIDVMTRAYNKDKGMDFITIVPGNLYGRYDNFHLQDGHVIPSLIHKCYNSIKNNKDFVVYGTGTALRQFTYAEDLVGGILWALGKYSSSKPLIISTDEEISISDVAETIAKHMGYDKVIKYDTYKSDGQYRKTVSNKKFMELHPEFEFMSVDTGIKKTVEWFKKNYEYARK